MLRFLITQLWSIPLTMRVSRALGTGFDFAVRGDVHRAVQAFRHAFLLAGRFPPSYFRECMRGRAILEIWKLTRQWEDPWCEIKDYSDDAKVRLGTDPGFAVAVATAELWGRSGT